MQHQKPYRGGRRKLPLADGPNDPQAPRHRLHRKNIGRFEVIESCWGPDGFTTRVLKLDLRSSVCSYALNSAANPRSRSQCDRTLAALRSDNAFCFDFAKVMAPE